MMIDLVLRQCTSNCSTLQSLARLSRQSSIVACFLPLVTKVHNPQKPVTQRVNLGALMTTSKTTSDSTSFPPNLRPTRYFSITSKSKITTRSILDHSFLRLHGRLVWHQVPPTTPQYDVAAPREPVLARMTLARATTRWHQFDHHQPQSSL